MSINKAFFRYLAGPVAVCMAMILTVQPLLGAVAVGQTASADTKVDGIWVPSGTTLLSPALVETGNAPAVLHLDTGEVVAIAPQSSAVLASNDGGVRLAVQRGRVAYTSDSGEVEYLSQSETLLASAQGETQEGARVATDGGEEDLCQLRNWTACLLQIFRFDYPDNEDCTWDHVEVQSSEVPRRVDKTSLLACKDRNPLKLECDCAPAAAVLWWIPIAAIGGGWAISEIIEKEKKPISPTTP